jgi:glycosyltransferase involved in cell wall biosynthesis
MAHVSIVVATRNCAGSLQRCLDSVARQKEARCEIVVIDGASSDATPSLLADNRTRGTIADYVSEPDGGVYCAFNKGVRRARGEWIGFVGCDDVLHDPFVVRDLLDAARSAPRGCRVIYGKVNLMSAAGDRLETVGRPWHEARAAFLEGSSLPHPAALHHRSLFEARGLFDESYRIAGDYELLLRELLHSEPLFLDRILVDMRVGGLSKRPDTIPVVLAEVIRARRQHGLGDAPARLKRALLAARAGAAAHALLGPRVFALLADAGRIVRGKPRVWTR